jgi:K(+)-stimulated pyrophosphate-energized sodium pump
MKISQAAVALFASFRRRSLLMLPAAFTLLLLLIAPGSGFAQAPGQSGGEAHLILPDLSQGTFVGIGGRTLLMGGLLICALGLVFGLITYVRLRDLPVHDSMREVSELIWETCKTYLFTQGRFLLILELFIGTIILFYF